MVQKLCKRHKNKERFRKQILRLKEKNEKLRKRIRSLGVIVDVLKKKLEKQKIDTQMERKIALLNKLMKNENLDYKIYELIQRIKLKYAKLQEMVGELESELKNKHVSF